MGRGVAERPWRIRPQRAAKQEHSITDNQVYGGSEAAAIRAMKCFAIRCNVASIALIYSLLFALKVFMNSSLRSSVLLNF